MANKYGLPFLTRVGRFSNGTDRLVYRRRGKVVPMPNAGFQSEEFDAAYRKADREISEMLDQNSTVEFRAALRGMLRRAKSRARNSEKFPDGISITFDDVLKMFREQDGCCKVSGLPFELTKRAKSAANPFAPSIDRIDNSKGYTVENCRLVCWGVNAGLNRFSMRDYRRICRAVIAKN